ncbi:MAG: CHRD domain-containing protein [Bauldia sp.]|nr:CHRD domain-containing protein [Bauldia sp.]MCW5716524.1 CHRD domain-containing protein [Bauldia sp.]
MRHALATRMLGFGAATAIVGASALAVAQAPALDAAAEDAFVTETTATHHAELTGANEVPANTTTGTGEAWILIDPQNNSVRWYVTYDGLTGPVTGAHIHGPAGVDENAGVIIDLGTGDTVDRYNSPIQGEITDLTAEQIAQGEAGMWYVNIHTEANPAGEIRGQIVVKDSAAAPAPM